MSASAVTSVHRLTVWKDEVDYLDTWGLEGILGRKEEDTVIFSAGEG